MKQTLRIIGGIYRGKKLHFPDIDGLRPTPDRVRETVFNWLMHDIHDARCLDAFAGSGALGLEAFSRGASQVTFIEQSTPAYNNLKKIITQFASPKLNLLNTNALNYLQKSNEQFDIIFLDPPFALNLLPECLNMIITHQLLAPKGLLYVERSESSPSIETPDFRQLKLKKSGQVVYALYTRA